MVKCTVSLSYTELSHRTFKYTASLGNTLNNQSFCGFMWFFSLDDTIYQNIYEYGFSTICIVSGCTSTVSCSYSAINLTLGISPGCIPNISSPTQNANGVECNCASGIGCNSTACLDCQSIGYSCLTTESYSTCPGGNYLSARSCISCSNDCSTCSEALKCTNCISNHASPSVTGCACNKGYYNGTLLNASSSCIECNGNHTLIDDSNFCKCEKGYYVASKFPTLCYACNNLCSQCFPANNCSECIENAILTGQNCSCKTGYSEFQGSCIRNTFTASITIDSKNNLTIAFSEDLEVNLNLRNFELQIEGIEFSWSLSQKSSRSYFIYLEFQTNIAQNTKLNLTILAYPLYSTLGSELVYYIYEVSLSPYRKPISSTIQTIAEVTSIASKTAASTAIASALIGNPAASWILINTIQFVGYISMNDNPLTPGLQAFFSSLGGYNMMPNLMTYIFDSNSTSLPYPEASNFGFNTSVFWINAGPTATTFFLFVSLLPFFFQI